MYFVEIKSHLNDIKCILNQINWIEFKYIEWKLNWIPIQLN